MTGDDWKQDCGSGKDQLMRTEGALGGGDAEQRCCNSSQHDNRQVWTKNNTETAAGG